MQLLMLLFIYYKDQKLKYLLDLFAASNKDLRQ